MGRGDKKTKKGKTFKGSFGKTRPAKVVKKKSAAKVKES
ncbi:MAG: 30S ribosomal protein THX [Chitinophagaceae bacterium]|nr:30S ribosomal protein THX [Chitinophagaceae bacterium]